MRQSRFFLFSCYNVHIQENMQSLKDMVTACQSQCLTDFLCWCIFNQEKNSDYKVWISEASVWESKIILNLNESWKCLQFLKIYVLEFVYYTFLLETVQRIFTAQSAFWGSEIWVNSEGSWFLTIPASLLSMCADTHVSLECSDPAPWWVPHCHRWQGFSFFHSVDPLTESERLILINTRVLPRSPSWC